MSITVISTTDSKETVDAVNGAKDSAKPVEEAKPASIAKAEDETKENSEALENESDEVEGDAAEESEDQSEEQEDDAKDDERKPKKGFKNRIQKLRGKLSAKEQEVNYWKEQALKGNAQTKDSQKEDAQKETKQDGKPIAPRMKDFETHEEYESARDEYQENLTAWNLKQWETERTAKERETQVKTEYQKALDSHNARIDEFKKTQKDYQDVVGEFLEDHGDIKFSPALEESILTSDLGPALLYELAKNPEELIRINGLSYGAAQRAIGKIEARLEKSSESSQTEIKKQTKAPPPVKPVGSSKAPVKKSIYDSDISQAEYEQLRREQMRNKAR